MRARTKEQFLEYAHENLRDVLSDEPGFDAEAAVVAVFEVITRHVTRGEVEDVLQQLPHQVREIWPREQTSG